MIPQELLDKNYESITKAIEKNLLDKIITTINNGATKLPIFSAAVPILRRKMNLQKITMRELKSTFGVSLEICYKIWKVCDWEKMVKKAFILGTDTPTNI